MGANISVPGTSGGVVTPKVALKDVVINVSCDKSTVNTPGRSQVKRGTKVGFF